MKALVRNSKVPGDISLHELEVPSPKGNQILAKVAYAGICASDLDILYHKNDIYRPPVVQGHEFSAVVEEVGNEVSDFKKGDYITSETTFNIKGVPNAHKLPDYQLMPGKEIVGWTVNGGFAEYMLLNANFCHKFSESTDLKMAALCEPLAIAAESLSVRGQLKKEDALAVIGPGPIGMLCALMAKQYYGTEKVFLIGLPEDANVRLAKAKALGLENCLTVDQPISEIIQQRNGGKKMDAVLDATGNIKGFELAMDLVKRNGKIIETGSITSDTLFSWEKAAYLALNLIFVFSSSNGAWKMATDFLNKTQLDLATLITGEFRLEDHQKAFKAAENSKEHIKVVFKPN